MPAESFTVSAMLALLLATTSGTGLATVHYGAPPPDFSIVADGGTNTPLSGLRGRPVVINFWASWCPPCRTEMPYFERLLQTYGSRVTLITISNEAPGVARAFLLANHYASLPLLEDPQGKIFAAYSIVPIPDTIVLSPQGDVVYVSVGGLDWKELNRAVQRALGVPTPPPVQGSGSVGAGDTSTPGQGLLR